MLTNRIALLVVLGSLAFTASASARVRPTFRNAHTAAHLVLDTYAQLVDGHLVVGPCRRTGAFSTVCRARIDGPSPARYRIVVTGTPDLGFWIMARAR